MIKVFNNPLLIDFLKIAAQMPEDEQKHMEALTGEPYDVDGAAVGNFMVAGPKWVIKVAESQEDFAAGRGRPIVVGGFALQRPGVWKDYLLTTPEAWKFWYPVTRICRRAMDDLINSGYAHRIETIVPAGRLAARPELEKWYKIMGYNKEGPRYGYCADGSDAIGFARVKH